MLLTIFFLIKTNDDTKVTMKCKTLYTEYINI